MLIIFSAKKKRIVRRAIAHSIIMCMTNQNGKTQFNHKAAVTAGFTWNDLQILKSFLPKPKRGIKLEVKK